MGAKNPRGKNGINELIRDSKDIQGTSRHFCIKTISKRIYDFLSDEEFYPYPKA